MKYAVFTVGMPELTPEEAVATLRELGYDGIEWRVVDQAAAADGQPGFWAGNRCTWPLSSFLADAPRIAELSRGAGLEIPSIGTYVRCDDLPAVEQAMEGVARLGAPQLRVNVPTYDGTVAYRELQDRAREQYHGVAELAARYGLKALFELPHGSIMPSASAAALFLQGFDPAHVGVIHDAGNMVYEGFESYRMGLEQLGPFLAHVHLKNAQWQPVGTRADGSTEWRCSWAPVSGGIVDMSALLRALRAVGYDGWVSFEDFSTVQPLPERLRDNLAFVKRVVASLDA